MVPFPGLAGPGSAFRTEVGDDGGMGDNVLIDHPADGVTRLTLNRPDDMNTLTYELVDDMHAALDAVDGDHSCRAVILTGSGRAFCAGLDLKGYGVVPGTEEFGRPQRGID